MIPTGLVGTLGWLRVSPAMTNFMYATASGDSARPIRPSQRSGPCGVDVGRVTVIAQNPNDRPVLATISR